MAGRQRRLVACCTERRDALLSLGQTNDRQTKAGETDANRKASSAVKGGAFSYRDTKDGRVQIFRSGAVVTTLAGNAAARFLARAGSCDADAAQLLMAKATGQYKFGNERAAKQKGK